MTTQHTAKDCMNAIHEIVNMCADGDSNRALDLLATVMEYGAQTEPKPAAPVTLHGHAAVIHAAINAAAADGYELDNRNGDPVYMDLNQVANGELTAMACVEIDVPCTFA